jgi:AcrR family transcriptional regulator
MGERSAPRPAVCSLDVRAAIGRVGNNAEKQSMAATAQHITPRQQERRDAILDAAREVFLERGFEGANLDQVIAKCGGSKRTLYAYFGNKSELFGAVVRDTSESMFDSLGAEIDDQRDLEAALKTIGRRYFAAVTRGTPLSLFRTVIREGPRFPELAQVFYQRGPQRAADKVDALLAQSEPGRRLPMRRRQVLAAHFFGLLREDRVFMPCILGLRTAPDDREIEDVVTQAVRIFLAGLHGAADEA